MRMAEGGTVNERADIGAEDVPFESFDLRIL